MIDALWSKASIAASVAAYQTGFRNFRDMPLFFSAEGISPATMWGEAMIICGNSS
ncbi:MAG: hypothetical protein QHC40_01955 [Sphingobium sp.]|nr:hypothetical protein [Sphingobium sp.]